MEETLFGSLWNMIGLLLTTVDVVMLRAVARHGALVDTFLMLKMEQFEWHCGSDSGRVHTTLLKRNPIMDSISRRQLDTVMVLSGNQAAYHARRNEFERFRGVFGIN